jgi:hypothetical protein
MHNIYSPACAVEHETRSADGTIRVRFKTKQRSSNGDESFFDLNKTSNK